MDKRKAFKFYKSYYDVALELPEKDRLEFLMAILEMQFTGRCRELKGMAKFAFISQKHSIDAQIEGYLSKTGATLPPNEPPIKAPIKQVQEKEKVQEKEEEKDSPLDDEIWMNVIKKTFPNMDYQKLWELCKNYHEAGPAPPKLLWQWKQKFQTWLEIEQSKIKQPEKKVIDQRERLKNL